MKQTLKQRMGKVYIAITVGLAVLVLTLSKYFVHEYKLDFIELNTLVGSVIGSATFITGFLLAGVFSDYKEAEKIPAEIRSALESIVSEGEALKRKDTGFDDNKIKAVVIKFVKEFEEGLSDVNDHSHMEHALEAIGEFDLIFDDMERRGLPPNYMTRIKSEQSNLRKALLRVYHIQKTKFVPSVAFLVESIVLLVILLLMFAETDLYTGVLQVGILSYLLLYTMSLIKVLEKPFRKGKDDTCDDVSIFLLRELAENLGKK